MSNIIKQSGWYLFAGVSAAVIELALFHLFYTYIHFPVGISNVCAVLIATTYNFIINRNVTFKSSTNPIRSSILYICLFVINLTITTFSISFLIDIGVKPIIAKGIMQVCVACWNFFLYRYIIFK